jgi:predicted kinase
MASSFPPSCEEWTSPTSWLSSPWNAGTLVLSHYQNASGDVLPETLLAFYRSYRACVRAKVTLLREQQASAGKPQLPPVVKQYFELADDNAAELGRPSLVVVGGMSGTGKSTLAEALADACGSDLLSTDQIRRSMHGPSPMAAGYGEGVYRPEERVRVYDALFRRADEALKGGRSMVLDGIFPTRQLRQRACQLGTTRHSASLFVLCACPRDVAMTRIDERAELGQSASEARADFYDVQAKEFEAPDPSETVVKIDTTRPVSDRLQSVYGALRRLLFT